MKLKVLAGLAAMALVAAAPAFPQTKRIEDYVRSLITDNVDPDEKLVGRIEISQLQESNQTSVTVHIDPSKMYIVYGACDDDCDDLDLVAEDSDGEEVDSDQQSDDAPMMLIYPGAAGDELTIWATMNSCSADACVLAVAVYEQ